MDLEKLRASDGTGPAALANITADRSVAATTIEVDNTENWPDEFIVVTGTLDANGYLTPASMCQMVAHLNAGDIEIDSFVPGYTDTGNTEGQVALIKQTVHGQDSIVDLLQIAHSDDGKIKENAPLNGGTTLGSGWLSAEEEWAYASFDAPTDTGTITVPSDATTKYSPGMRIKITQVTGGTKYGIITKVEATVLTVYFGTDYTLNNEDITAPCFSMVKAPFGFPLDPTKWTLETISGSARTISSASWASLTDSLVVPIGMWRLVLKAAIHRPYAASTSNDFYKITLSSTTNSETNPDLTMHWNIRFGSAGASSGGGYTGQTDEIVPVAAQTTFTFLGIKVAGSNGSISADDVPTVIKAICAYL